MKKNIYIVLFGLLLSMGVASCDNDSDLLFDKSAAERKEGANKEYDDALKSAEQGWLFQYFPEETQKYGGYNFVVKFAEDNKVTVWSENMSDLTTPETSMYDVISYGGPVLTFNTYNSLMHEFANPSAAAYLAKGGDFEFLIMSNENDVMTVKGIKTGNTMNLIKMTETAEEYFAKTKVISDFVSGASLGATINNVDVEIVLGNRQFTFNYIENDEDKSETIAFIYTDKGIRLYEPMSILGISVQEFTLNTEEKTLVSFEGNLSIEVIFPPINLNSISWTTFMSYESERSPAVRTAWENSYIANDNTWAGEILSDQVIFGLGINTTGILMKSDAYYAQYNVTFGGVKGEPDYLSMKKVDGGYNWNFYSQLMPMVDIIVDNAPYVVVVDNEENPTIATLTSVSNPDIWFVLRQ
jgi:hypothetical protein